MTATSHQRRAEICAAARAKLPLEGQPDTTDIETMIEDIHHLNQCLSMRDRQIEAVHRISAALFSKTSLDSLLRETLRVFLETVDADAGSIWLYDDEKRKLVCRHVYRGAASLIGYELDPEDPNAKAAMVYRTGQSLITDTRTQTYNKSVDDRTGYHTDKILTVPLKNLGGEPIGVMQALNKRAGQFDQDDLELMEIVSSLAATSIVNARLAEEAQLAAVARAVGDLGHDIKNALTPIETMVDTTIGSFIAPMYTELDQLLAEWQQTNPDLAITLQQATDALREWYPEMETAVKDGCADIREMVSEIADYIKGAQATNIEAGNLKEVIEERLRRLNVVARNRRVTLHLEGMETVPPFAFDRRLLGRAIFNLVNNALGAINDAVKKKVLPYRPEGFNIWVRASAVTGGAFPAGNYCLIEVQDDGPGIPPRVKSSLFTDQTISTTPGGTGIGTRFVKSVADAHGGQVGVESEIGHGSRFWMKLPLERGE
ncbi:MAG TPA: GAF domain-containing sensor histidine kinase [Chthonomonadaceae bacterium]|nr:GAF domain-containing sensor histidine kinase [Chthonomonadaceae bacterium]